MNTSELKNKLSKSIDFLVSELNQIRTGRVSPTLVSDVSIEAYPGSFLTIKELGSISVMDPHNLAIMAWDKTVLDLIVNGLRNSGLGVSAVKEADRVRVSVPALTEEKRVEFTKQVSEEVENCKNSIRKIRQDAMKEIEKEFSEKSISEDEKFKEKELIEEIVKDFIDQADKIGEEKKKELMTI
jgi:ribosome recycling factor